MTKFNDKERKMVQDYAFFEAEKSFEDGLYDVSKFFTLGIYAYTLASMDGDNEIDLRDEIMKFSSLIDKMNINFTDDPDENPYPIPSRKRSL